MADDSTIKISVDAAIEAAALLRLRAWQQRRNAAKAVRSGGFVHWRLAIDYSNTMRRLREFELALGRLHR